MLPALEVQPIRTVSRMVGLVWLALAGLTACGGGQWGYAQEYDPWSEEEDLLEGTTALTYEEVRRDPADFRSAKVAWFGTVETIGDGQIELAFRTLSARNLCSDESAGSCRVTVNERKGGPFIVKLTLRPEHTEGPDRVWEGTLMRVIGSPTGELDPETGGPVIDAEWYRHWPHGKYVTTGARGSMRR